MKFIKVIKANLSQERIEQIKKDWANELFDLSNNDHYDLKKAIESDIDLDDETVLTEQDFKAITGLSYDEYDNKMLNLHQKQKDDEDIEDLEYDIEDINNILNEGTHTTLAYDLLYDVKHELQAKLDEIKSKYK